MRVFNPIVLIVPLLIIDLYVYRGLSRLLKCRDKGVKSLFFWIYWLVSAGLLTGILVAMRMYKGNPSDIDLFKGIMNYNAVFLIAFVFKIGFAFFTLISDLLNLFSSIRHKVFTNKKIPSKSKPISRANFILKIGAVISMVPVLGLIHGVGWGRFHFTLHQKKIKIPGLPAEFNGFKIVQLSDAHLGSLAGNEARISDVMDQINDLKPDILVFTGDMVNNFAHEISGWVPIWQKLKTTYGKFSVLGNHDYGGYSSWPSENAKKRNLQDNIRQQREMGFDVLLNENRIITKGNSSIYIAGVENWGKPPFPQHGKLEKALGNIPAGYTTILLSHDPDHFELQIKGKTNVDLTLSGHTHGAQFGIEIGKFKISPVQLRYKRWAGLYQEGEQYLYVNRGLGYLAFPGRVGIWPEITLLELVRDV